MKFLATIVAMVLGIALIFNIVGNMSCNAAGHYDYFQFVQESPFAFCKDIMEMDATSYLCHEYLPFMACGQATSQIVINLALVDNLVEMWYISIIHTYTY
ncbi:unnamed protein product [Prunus armeniaca]|uniref:Uncharacterized protein n=1 Tax=Prunus armeniaca TaxID=36596 RepID=A0A6J5YDT3_PRUAR|nr:unnamed protein product [Prunus armeniaca]